jgi:hypothetical protein
MKFQPKIMTVIFLLLVIILGLSSCLNGEGGDHFLSETEIKIYNEWLYTYKIQNLLPSGEVITRPPGVNQLIFRLTIPNVSGLNVKTHCVYYQVPYKKIQGIIKILESKNDGPCLEVDSGESWLELRDVKDLRVKLENFKLSLDFTINNQKKSWSFLLPNIEEGLIHEKYQPVKQRKLYSGMTFLRISNESFLNQNNKYLGKLSDRVSRGSSIRCHQVDKNCENVGENRCDECRYGWYQVVDFQCPQGGSKFCGQSHCGEKNEPACPRGIKVVDAENLGICQNDLSPVWNADHVLICQ